MSFCLARVRKPENKLDIRVLLPGLEAFDWISVKALVTGNEQVTNLRNLQQTVGREVPLLFNLIFLKPSQALELRRRFLGSTVDLDP